jgi:hypothetical protein
MAIPLAILCALVLAGMGLSVVTWLYATTSARAAEQQTKALEARMAEILEATQGGLNALTVDLRELERQPQVTLLPGTPRAGLNLAKRSQVLRMHRRGESAEQIAVGMSIPRSEVDLLLKVHQIVISNI